MALKSVLVDSPKSLFWSDQKTCSFNVHEVVVACYEKEENKIERDTAKTSNLDLNLPPESERYKNQ